MRRAVLAALGSLAVALPASAAASDSAEVRRVDLGSFPAVQVTALAPAGSRPVRADEGVGQGRQVRQEVADRPPGQLQGRVGRVRVGEGPLRAHNIQANHHIYMNNLAEFTGQQTSSDATDAELRLVRKPGKQ